MNSAMKIICGGFIIIAGAALAVAGKKLHCAGLNLLALEGEQLCPIRYYGDSSDFEETR